MKNRRPRTAHRDPCPSSLRFAIHPVILDVLRMHHSSSRITEVDVILYFVYTAYVYFKPELPEPRLYLAVLCCPLGLVCTAKSRLLINVLNVYQYSSTAVQQYRRFVAHVQRERVRPLKQQASSTKRAGRPRKQITAAVAATAASAAATSSLIQYFFGLLSPM